MTYVPINVYAYTAAYSGAIAGMAVTGWIVDPLSTDYAQVTVIAGAFAQEFDTLWNSATQLTFLEMQATQSIVAQEFSLRGPGPLASGVFSLPSSWTKPAAACAALVLQSDTFFAGLGIVPPSPSTGSGLPPVTVADNGDILEVVAGVWAKATPAPSGGCSTNGVIITGNFACAENNLTTASGDFSHAEGDSGSSTGQASHVEGTQGTANGVSAHAEGFSVRADGNNSHAEGNATWARGNNSHAEGTTTTANALNAHVEGDNTNATGTSSHAEGRGSASTKTAAHAEGVATNSNGFGSHTEGNGSVANGDDSHAEGNTTTATGASSHAEGRNCVATGIASHAMGFNSVAFLDTDYAHSGAGFHTPGDGQFRRSLMQGFTPGVLPGETVALMQGVGATAVPSVNHSTAYAVTVRATAHANGLGAGARQAAFFYFAFLMTVNSVGTVTISAVTVIVPPILQGAGFVGATLVPSAVAANQWQLTFAVAGGLTVSANVVATVEFVEVVSS